MAPSQRPEDRGSVKADVASFKRQQILEVAVKLFLQNGYHGTPVDAIASALGVSKQFVYYQFTDKAAILNALCTTGAELTLSAIVDADDPTNSATECIARFAGRLTEIVIDHGHYLAVYASEVTSLNDNDRKRILGIRADIDRRVSELIRRGITTEQFTAEDPLTAARAITGMISYMWTWAHTTDPAERERLVADMTRIALRSLDATHRRDQT